MRLRLLFSTLFLSAALFGASPGPASAIVDGQLDEGEHPYVGLVRVLRMDSPGSGVCTGTLVAPTKVITAAHCFVIVPATPNRDVLFTLDNPASPASAFVHGTAAIHPGFDPRTTTGLVSDVAVITLDAPYPGARHFGKVARLGRADHGKKVEIVGYGLTAFPPACPADNCAPPTSRYKKKVGFSQNPASRNHLLLEPGACFGDSGGPNLRGRHVVSITSFALSPNCSGPAGAYRLDTTDAQAFLAAQGVPVPSRHDDDDDDEGEDDDDDGRGKGGRDDDGRDKGDRHDDDRDKGDRRDDRGEGNRGGDDGGDRGKGDRDDDGKRKGGRERR